MPISQKNFLLRLCGVKIIRIQMIEHLTFTTLMWSQTFYRCKNVYKFNVYLINPEFLAQKRVHH